MSGKKAAADGGTSAPVNERRRALLKILTASAGAYAAPMVASFSMSGLRIGEAEAGAPLQVELIHKPIDCAFSQPFNPPGLPVAANQKPPGRAFNLENPPPGFTQGQKSGVPFNPISGNATVVHAGNIKWCGPN